MKEKHIPIKEVSLNNHCPVCYSTNGLHLTFKQRIVETNFYRSITSEITNDIKCTTCKTTIYPVQWTDDLERVFEYHKKMVSPKKPSTYLKKWSWVLLVLLFTIGFIMMVLWVLP